MLVSRCPLVIWGASGHAAVVADAARASGKFEIVGFLDDRFPDGGPEFCQAPILGGRERLGAIRARGISNLIFGFGDCQGRLSMSAFADDAGFVMATVLHPQSIIAGSAILEPGCFVAAGAVISPEVVLRRNVIVNSTASVDHHCEIGEASHICPGVHLGGSVYVGRGTWIGIGATVIEKIRIDEGSVIGAGSVVVRDIPKQVVAYGVPARIVRKLYGGK